MKRAPAHQTITPRRALDLLLELQFWLGDHRLTEQQMDKWAVERTRNALKEHVLAALMKKRRK